MTYLAATERVRLCDLALELGPQAPTLCDGWDVRDLVAHLVLRDGSLAALGAVAPPFAALADRGMARLERRHGFEALVSRLRQGPPRYSPFRLKRVDRLLNAMEYFVHHEDIRRAQPGWVARDLDPRVQDALWRGVTSGGRGLVRKAVVGVVVSRSDRPATATLKSGDPHVTVHGRPAEVALFVYGRSTVADVELWGNDADVALLSQTALGI